MLRLPPPGVGMANPCTGGIIGMKGNILSSPLVGLQREKERDRRRSRPGGTRAGAWEDTQISASL